ncbi:hypothetical protein LOTGIDRAFT_206174 [Lottia gigantea]|uniref:GH3 domain-containing protein n=1 Tax=Lottia gigantea TaxID=225164 RepID=V4AS59_LOTGI|nr:hypothetical protein LOTGIDRAFT_206174 [Lottia gigantea]ESP00098.1 hypothetical protein LOTGIDRAFT_206174 [Lottia gigantea]
MYFFKKLLTLFGRYRQNKLVQNSKNVMKIQEKFLFDQLALNAETEYGKKYNFSKVNSVADFKSYHPLTRYDHYKPYVERMMKGETKIMTSNQPVIFAVTSGTSGNSNIIPMVKRQQALFFLDGISLLFHLMTEFFPKSNRFQKHLKFFYDPIKWRESDSGIKIGPNSSSPSNSKSVLFMYTTPIPAYKVLNEPEALYLHLLFGLKERNLGMIEANFSSIVYNSFVSLENHWDDLVNDIEKELTAVLKPDPQRAAELKEAKKDGPTGLMKRIWPECNLVIGADSGSFELYATKLRETYLKGIPLYSPIYAATEGLLGINIWPREYPSKYMLIPTVQFYEFIPIADCDLDQPDTLLMNQVKEGESYELVITNPTCLYRYRFGDVVRVKQFYNQCPVIEFLYRQGQFLSVRGEKTSEAVFYKVLNETLESSQGLDLVDYCCCESILVSDQLNIHTSVDTSPSPCYHVFIEFKSDESINEQRCQQLAKQLDDNLCAISYVYSSFRKKGSIGPIRIHCVQDGSFHRLRNFSLETTSASFNQYKVPRVLKNKDSVEFITKLIQ